MGCFNAACSISHMDILCGDKCYFLILAPNKYQRKEGEGSVNCYTTDRYKLFCLPIVGKYNDYGMIEEIERTPHTDFLEKRFNMTIEELIEIACETRNVYDYFSTKFNHFVINKDIIKNDSRKIMDIVTALNFASLGENKYLIKDIPIMNTKFILEVLDENRYAVWQDETKLYTTSMHRAEDFFVGFHEKTGIYLNVTDAKELEELNALAGCFVLKDVADKIFAKKEFNTDWYYENVQKWDITPGLVDYLGFKTKGKGIYKATKNGNKYQINFEGEPKMNGTRLRAVKDLQAITHDFDEEIQKMEEECTRFDFCSYNFALGIKAKQAMVLGEFGYYCERFCETSSVVDLNSSFKYVYQEAYKNWKFDKEFVLATKLLYLFSMTHNMLAPTCNASQDNNENYLLLMYQMATEFAEERKKRCDEC